MKTIYAKLTKIFLIVGILFLTNSVFAQTDTSASIMKIDKLTLRAVLNDDDEIVNKEKEISGTTIHVNIETVDFKILGTDFNTTFKKTEIKQIVLSNGQVLTFGIEKQTAQEQIAKTYKDNSTVWYVLIGLSVVATIIAVISAGSTKHY